MCEAADHAELARHGFTMHRDAAFTLHYAPAFWRSMASHSRETVSTFSRRLRTAAVIATRSSELMSKVFEYLASTYARLVSSKRRRSILVVRGQLAISRGSLSSASDRKNFILCERGTYAERHTMPNGRKIPGCARALAVIHSA